MDNDTRQRLDQLVSDILRLANDVSGHAQEVSDQVPPAPAPQIRGGGRSTT